MDNDERKNIIEIWKAVVGVQQHFNEIEMKVRGLFITIVVAIAAGSGLPDRKETVCFDRALYDSVCECHAVVGNIGHLSILFR
jgi:hypothetical protein